MKRSYVNDDDERAWRLSGCLKEVPDFVPLACIGTDQRVIIILQDRRFKSHQLAVRVARGVLLSLGWTPQSYQGRSKAAPKAREQRKIARSDRGDRVGSPLTGAGPRRAGTGGARGGG